MRRAREMGCRVKLVAYAARKGDAIEACVSPALLPSDHPLAQVKDVFNAIMLEGEPVGRVMFYGRGAGGMPTASAVVSDIMQAVRPNVFPGHRRERICRVLSPQGVPQVDRLRVWG
jgi:homoserine dehydrogenase